MKKRLRRCLWFFLALISLLFLSFVIVCGLVYYGYHQHKLAQWVGDYFNANVSLGSSHVQWHHGQIAIKLTSLTVVNKDSQKTILAFSQADLSLSVRESIRHLAPIFKNIEINHLKLQLAQHTVRRPAQSSKKYMSFHFNIPPLLRQWLFVDNQIVIKQSQLTINLGDGTPVKFDDVNAHWQHDSLGKGLLNVTSRINQNQGLRTKSDSPETTGLFRLIAQVTDPNKHLHIDGYLKFKSPDFSALFHQSLYDGIYLKQGGGVAELWLHWQSSQLKLQAKLDLSDAIFASRLSPAILKRRRLSLNLLWQRQQSGAWQLRGSETLKGIKNPELLSIAYTPHQANDAHWQINARTIPLHTLMHLLLLSKQSSSRFKQFIRHHQPEGQLKQLYIDAQFSQGQLTDYVANAQLHHLSLQRYQDAPAVSGIDVALHATNAWGRATVEGNTVKIGANKWFPDMDFRGKFYSHLSWQKHQHWQVLLDSFALNTNWLQLFVHGSINRPLSKNPMLKLLGGFHAKDAGSEIKKYANTPLLGKNFSNWLQQAVVSVPDLSGKILLSGNPSQLPFKQQQGILQIDLQTKDMSLSPYQGWPLVTHVTSDMLFQNDQFFAAVDHAESLGLTMSHTDFSIPLFGANTLSFLISTAHIDGAGSAIHRFIDQSPLKKTLGAANQALAFSGHVMLDLHTDYALTHENYPHVLKGSLHFNNNALTVVPVDLTLNRLNGIVSFNQGMIQATKLTGSLMKLPVHIAMGSQKSRQGISHRIVLSGVLAAKNFQHSPYAFLSQITHGSSPFTMAVTVRPEVTTCHISSALQGLAVNLPPPFDKRQKSKKPFSLKLTLAAHDDNIPLQFSWQHAVNGHLLFDKQGEHTAFSRGQIQIGQDSMPVLPKKKGLFINGQLDSVDLSQWVKMMKLLPTSHHANSLQFSHLLKKLALQINQFHTPLGVFDHVGVGSAWLGDHWQLKIKSPTLDGDIDLPADWHNPSFGIHLDQLQFDFPSKKQNEASQLPSISKLSRLPKLYITVKRLSIGHRLTGRLNLHTQPMTSGIEVKQLEFSSTNLKAQLKGSAQVLVNKACHKHSKVCEGLSENQFALSGTLSANAWGKVLDNLGYSKLMQEGQGPVKFDLNWRGELQQPEVDSINGWFNFKLENGSLEKINPGFARLFGLLSLNSIEQRLQMNFQDITEKGLRFNTLTGKYSITHGVALTKRVSFSGPALDLVMNGELDFVNKAIDQYVVVMPQIGGSLALAATLIGGPIAGLATWLADKVLTNTILKDKGLVYKVSGPWQDPSIKSYDSSST